MTTHRLHLLAAAAALLLAACGDDDNNGPTPGVGAEVLVVVNSTEATLSVVPTDNPAGAVKVALGGTTPTPTGVSARDSIAIVPMGLDNSVVVVDLIRNTVARRIALPANSGATGSAIVDDSIAYVANPNLNSVTRVNYLTGTTSSVPVGRFPQGIVFARGEVWVLNGNLDETFTPAGPSWITVIDPRTNAVVASKDSIPLSGEGNAQWGDVDGTDLWVMSSGPFGTGQGALSVVDMMSGAQTAVFGGFGVSPGNVATNGNDFLYVSSYSEGVMQFDAALRDHIRGAGQGLAIPSNAFVEVDRRNRVYAIESGPCSGGEPGTVHVLDPNLTETGTFTVGECAVSAAFGEIPD